MADAKQFRIDLNREVDDFLDAEIVAIKQKVSMELLARITMKMPVDTGRARGNTTVSIAVPDYTVTANTDPSGQETIERGQKVILGPQGTYDSIWIANALPYIERLENGWSKQAPAGMFKLSVAEVNVMFEG